MLGAPQPPVKPFALPVSLNFSKVSIEYRDATGGTSKAQLCDFRSQDF